jgi:hypothetical protein
MNKLSGKQLKDNSVNLTKIIGEGNLEINSGSELRFLDTSRLFYETTPTDDDEVVNKLYVDSMLGDNYELIPRASNITTGLDDLTHKGIRLDSEISLTLEASLIMNFTLEVKTSTSGVLNIDAGVGVTLEGINRIPQDCLARIQRLRNTDTFYVDVLHQPQRFLSLPLSGNVDLSNPNGNVYNVSSPTSIIQYNPVNEVSGGYAIINVNADTNSNPINVRFNGSGSIDRICDLTNWQDGENMEVVIKYFENTYKWYYLTEFR